MRGKLSRHLGRRRLLMWLAPLGVLALIGLGVVWYAIGVRDGRFNVGASVLSEEQLAARTELHSLETRRYFEPRMTTAFVSEVRLVSEQFEGIGWPDRSGGFRGFLEDVRSQLSLETENRLLGLIRERDRLLALGRFQDALEYVRTEGTLLTADSHLARDRVRGLRDSTRRQIERSYEDLVSELRNLREQGATADALAAFDVGLRRFAGTRHVDALERSFTAYREEVHERRQSRLARLRERAQKRGEARRKELAASLISPGEPEPETLAEQVWHLLRPGIESGCAEGEVIADGASVVVRSVLGRDLIVQPTPRSTAEPSSAGESDGAAGSERRVPIRRVPAASAVELAADCLEGASLLAVVELAWRDGLHREADRLSLRYLRSVDGPSGRADKPLAELLSELRGEEAIPPGGYQYSKKHGWEDRPSRVRRETLERARPLLARLSRARSVRHLDEAFEKLSERIGDSELDGAELDGATRRQLRDETWEILQKTLERTVRGVKKRVSSTGFRRLRLARAELDKRRVAALAVIYDAKIYLPESHPDWTKGDVVNGQREVDRRVDAVRELWTEAGSYALRVDRNTAAKVQLIQRIDELCATDLERPSDRRGRVELEDLLNNLDEKIDLRNFSRNRAEVLEFEYNRRVEAYNRDLVDEDVFDTDKQHVAVVNDYREMMGRRRLFIDARLCRATRKHSAACDAAGRIWHDGPDGSPGSRARAEGFPAGVGENVCIGYANPADTWVRGWYRASDHHRNGLAAGWNCIGYGYSGRVGTQNFASIGAPFR